ncbi:unnamed protein product [Pylaiella littoralis]
MSSPSLFQEVVVERVCWPEEKPSCSGPKSDKVILGESLVRGMDTAFRGYFSPLKYRSMEPDRDLRGFVRFLMRDDDGLLVFADGGGEEMARLNDALSALDTRRIESSHYSFGDFLGLLGQNLGGKNGAVYQKGFGFVVPGEECGKSLWKQTDFFIQRAKEELDRIFCSGSREDFMQRLQEKNPGEYQSAPRSTPGIAPPATWRGVGEALSDMDVDGHDRERDVLDGWHDDKLRSTDENIAAVEQQLAAVKMGRQVSSSSSSDVSSSSGAPPQLVKEQVMKRGATATGVPLSAPAVQHSSRWQSELQVSDDVERRMAVKASQPTPAEEDDSFVRKGPLSDEQERDVDRVFEGRPDGQVLVKAFNADLTRRDLKCLRPFTWLNDEVVNMYMQLLAVRDKELCNANPKRRPSHFFNSFFLAKLRGHDGKYNYKGVRRWTRKVKVFEMDKIFVPVNVSNTHWCMAVIYMKHKRINYFDSMGGSGKNVTNSLLDWLEDEDDDKNGDDGTFDPDDWTTEGTNVATTPQQENGSDCGAFAVSFASYISDDLPLDFRQADITQMRRRMLWSLLNQCLV